MFENLSTRLQEIFKKLSGKGRLSEADVDAALREVRLALLEADVNFRVVKDFVARVGERAIGADVMKSLTPAQMVIKIVHEELIVTLGEARQLNLSGPPPHVVMLAGLQGSGKTTMAAKLALKLRQSGQRPLLGGGRYPPPGSHHPTGGPGEASRRRRAQRGGQGPATAHLRQCRGPRAEGWPYRGPPGHRRPPAH